jgi:hypothetical protein
MLTEATLQQVSK